MQLDYLLWNRGQEAAYKALFARTPPGAAIQFVAIRLSVTAPMPGTGGKLELPRHSSANAEKGIIAVIANA